MPNIEIVCYSMLSAARDIILGALLICMSRDAEKWCM
jgi:hypothetical protein